jgi:hypothetical protein
MPTASASTRLDAALGTDAGVVARVIDHSEQLVRP